MLHGCPSQEPNYRRSAAELEKAIVECAGWLCTLGCKNGCSTTRMRGLVSVYERLIIAGVQILIVSSTIRHWKDEKVGKKPCVVGEPQWRSGSQSANLYQASVKLTPRINLMPRPSRTCEKECLVFWVTFLVTWGREVPWSESLNQILERIVIGAWCKQSYFEPNWDRKNLITRSSFSAFSCKPYCAEV